MMGKHGHLFVLIIKYQFNFICEYALMCSTNLKER